MAASTPATGIATRGAGIRLVTRGTASSSASVAAAITSSPSEAEPRACHMRAIRSKKLSGARGRLEAEDVLDLQRGDHRGDPGGEAGRDRVRDELDELTETAEPHRDQNQPAHQAGEQQPGHAEAGIDGGQDDDEGRGRTRHLQPRAAQRRHHRAGDDRGVEPILRRHPDRDRERHRQGKRDDADHQARQHVGAQIGARVPFPPDGAHRPGGKIAQLDAVERRSIPGAGHPS